MIVAFWCLTLLKIGLDLHVLYDKSKLIQDLNGVHFSTLLLKCCHKKQEIVGNIFRMFGLGS